MPTSVLETVEAARKPCIKYPGSKRDVAHLFVPYWEPYKNRRLVELFVGSAAVSLHLQPQRALLNDRNPNIINLHKQLQIGLTLEEDWENNRESYFKLRARFNQLIETRQHQTSQGAQMMIALSAMNFRGHCRFNLEGKYNVSYGNRKVVHLPADFKGWKIAYQNWAFSCNDFKKVALEPDDFVYADPPYADSEEEDIEGTIQMSLFDLSLSKKAQKGFTSYDGQNFTWSDQVDLAHYLSAHPGPVLASNAYSHRLIELYGDLGFEIDTIEVQRKISRTGEKPIVLEMLAFKR